MAGSRVQVRFVAPHIYDRTAHAGNGNDGASVRTAWKSMLGCSHRGREPLIFFPYAGAHPVTMS
jgi:hypothetical protein